MESDDYSAAVRGGRHRSYGSRGANGISRGGAIGGGHTTSSQIIFHLKGAANAISLQCTIQSTRRMTARRASSLETFINDLKNAHKRILLKMGAKDPYGEETSSSRKASGQGSNIRGRSAKANSRLITPASHNLYLSPLRNKPSKREHGELRSSSLEKRRNGVLNPQSSERDGVFDDSQAIVQGNVVRQQPGTPNTRKTLELTAKSPMNATPLKQRLINSGNPGAYSDDEDDDGFTVKKIRRRDQNSGSSVSGGGRYRKLKSRVNQKLMNFEDSEEEDAEAEKLEKRQLESVNEGDRKDEGGSGFPSGEKNPAGESNKEVYKSVPKKKRLTKVRRVDSLSGDNNDIEVDFEHDANTNSCRKKLRLSFENEDGDEDDYEGRNNKSESPTPTKTDDSSRVLLSNSSKSVTDDEKNSGSPSSTTAASQAHSSKDRVSERKDLNASKAKNIATATKPINSFFAPRSAKKQQDLKRSPPTDLTYGATLSSPRKNTDSWKEKTPLTPIRPASNSSNVDITPVSKQVQRKSSYFSQINADVGIKTDSSESPRSDEAEYASDGSLGDLNSNFYEENGDDIFSFNDENSDRNANAAKRQQQNQIKNPYDRRNIRNRFNALGQSRLASRAPVHSLTSSAVRLDFGDSADTIHYSAPNFFAAKRGSHFKPIRSPSEEDLSAADRALNKSGDSEVVVDDDHKDKDDAANATVPGIRNLGNTCYLSASLQTLFCVPDFIKDLYVAYKNQHGTKELPLTKALLEVANAVGVLSNDASLIESSDTTENKLLASIAANPTALKKQMDVLTSKFAGFFQRDAHEFLSDLIDFLHDELAAEKCDNDASKEAEGDSKPAAAAGEDRIVVEEHIGSSNHDPDEVKNESSAKLTTTNNAALPTDDFFHLKVRVCLECNSCGYSRSKDELYRHLSIEVGNDNENDVWTVEQGLKQFFHSEKRDVKCEKCDDGKTATQTIEIISCPKALLLHFKRFIVTQELKPGNGKYDKESDGKSENKAAFEMVLKKNKAKILLEESLSITPFIGDKVKSPEGLYRLCGVVHHIGNTASSGHYTSCAKRKLAVASDDSKAAGGISDEKVAEEEWVFFDDRVGRKKSLDYVVDTEKNQRNCYLALYELR